MNREPRRDGPEEAIPGWLRRAAPVVTVLFVVFCTLIVLTVVVVLLVR